MQFFLSVFTLTMADDDTRRKEENMFLSIWNNVCKRKPIERSLEQSKCKKTLHWYHLLAYGVSATIGSGIYLTIGQIAKTDTGPAVILSVLMAGTLSCLTAFCYLDLAAIVPSGGSAYTYGFTFIGELAGWLLGWIATLEYSFAGACTAVAISQYLSNFVERISDGRVVVPVHFTIADDFIHVNIIALVVTLLVSLVVLKGIVFGARANNILASINISLLTFIAVVGCFYVNPANLKPFFKKNDLDGSSGASDGVFRGALSMIYSYIGFDTICVLAADAKSPAHIQVAVLGTLLLATFLYMTIGLVMTGMIPLDAIVTSTPLSSAFESINLAWVAHLVRVCALLMLVATLLACLLGQPKIFHFISLDGLLPPIFKKATKRRPDIPVYNVAICCLFASILATFFKIQKLVEIISVGALVGFTVNALCLIFARLDGRSAGDDAYHRTDVKGRWAACSFLAGCTTSWLVYQNLSAANTLPSVVLCALLILCPFGWLSAVFYWSAKERSHTSDSKGISPSSATATFCPLMPLIPCLSICGSTFILSTVDIITWCQFLGWVLIGLLLYVTYGYRHSTVPTGPFRKDQRV